MKSFERFKQKLLEEKNNIENDLSELAVKTTDKGDGWKVKLEEYDQEASAQEDKSEDEGAEMTLVQQMKERLKDINDALDKIERGAYGICEHCGQPIDSERLEAYPEARTHTRC